MKPAEDIEFENADDAQVYMLQQLLAAVEKQTRTIGVLEAKLSALEGRIEKNTATTASNTRVIAVFLFLVVLLAFLI